MMRLLHVLAAITFAAAASPLSAQPAKGDPRLAKAEAFIDAFYAFDPARLRATLADAPRSAPFILYYQGWAEGGNYRVLDRQPCRLVTATTVDCAITVRDDLLPALKVRFNATDTFRLTFQADRIVAVDTRSNDPPIVDEALRWIGKEHSELLEGACKGYFDGGPTPQACIREAIKRFPDFLASRKR